MAKAKRADVNTANSTTRRLDFTGWDIDYLEVSNDLNSGQIVVTSQAGNKHIAITPTLAEAQAIHDLMGAAIAEATTTAARMSDHQAAVCFMVSTGSPAATFNQETVHEIPKGPDGARCLMCGLKGHQIGPVDVSSPVVQ